MFLKLMKDWGDIFNSSSAKMNSSSVVSPLSWGEGRKKPHVLLLWLSGTISYSKTQSLKNRG